FSGLTAIGDPVGRGYYVALVRKEEPELLRAVNQAILDALRDGRLRRIYDRYGMWNQTQMLRGLETNSEGNFVGDISAKQPSSGQAGEAEETYVPVSGWGVIAQRGGLLLRAAGMTVL